MILLCVYIYIYIYNLFILQLFCFRPSIKIKSTNKMLRFQLHLSGEKIAEIDLIIIFSKLSMYSYKKKTNQN